MSNCDQQEDTKEDDADEAERDQRGVLCFLDFVIVGIGKIPTQS